MQTSVKLDHTVLAVEQEHDVHAMLEISVPAGPDASERPPLRLALVVDRSGSMAGPKLAVAKRCARWLVERLRPQDELALVTYDDRVRLLAPLEPVQPARLQRAIASLGPGGQTNLSGGWLRGLEQLRAAPAEGARDAPAPHGWPGKRGSHRPAVPRRDDAQRARRRRVDDDDRFRRRLRRGPADCNGRRGRRERPLRRDARRGAGDLRLGARGAGERRCSERVGRDPPGT